MTHGRYYCFQIRMISASFTDTQQQNADHKMMPALFFLRLMDENKYYSITNKINK